MSYSNSNIARKSKSEKKRKPGKNQLHNVISMRISDEEKRALEKLTKSTSKSVSAIMREAIDLWRSKRRQLCID